MKIRDVLSLLCGYQGDDVDEGFRKLYESFGIPRDLADSYHAVIHSESEWNMDSELNARASMVQNNTVEGQNAEFHLNGPIVSAGVANFLREIGEEAVSARDFRNYLAANEGDVTVRFNSPGGSVSQAAEIISLLAERQQKAKVTAIIDGVAASAAAITFLSAKTRLVSEYSRLMFHRSHVALLVQGNVADVRRAAESTIQQMESFDALQIAAYRKVTGADESEARTVFDKDTWFNPDEALANNLATGKAFENEPKASTETPEAQAIEKAGRDLIELYELAAFMA